MRRRYGTGFKPDGINVDLPLELVLTITGTGAETADIFIGCDPWSLSDPRDRVNNGYNHTAQAGVITITPFNTPTLWGQTKDIRVVGSTFAFLAYQSAVPLLPGALTIDLALPKMTPICSAGADLERPTGGYLVNISALCGDLPPDGSKVNVYEGTTLIGTATVAGGVVTGTIDTTEMEDGVHFVDVWWFNDAHADYCSTFLNLTTAGG